MFTSSLTLSHHLPFSPLALISPHPCSQSRCPSLPGPPLYSHVSACYSFPTAEQHNPGVLEFSCINLIEYLCLYAPECWLFCIMDVQRHAVLGKLIFFFYFTFVTIQKGLNDNSVSDYTLKFMHPKYCFPIGYCFINSCRDFPTPHRKITSAKVMNINGE